MPDTITLPKEIQARYLATAVAEHQNWQATERETALKRLAELDGEWEKTIPELDEKIRAAGEKIATAKAALQKAEDVQHRAIWDRKIEASRLDREREELRNRIERDLTDNRITEALHKLEAIQEQSRQIPLSEPKDSGHFKGQSDAELVRGIEARMEWVRESREALEALRYNNPKDLEKEIEKIMAGLPAL